eukprot:TRINITY_DN40383_c0_g1_i1.p1 TRINITY_DN40383_c0_g1~~TRINITY_DN40383_c0_g1_i1.p1  ORF type:complete len:1174 (+),score=313.23 TRINITY_DN40383_c0_g1_i1:63-3584(+)
MFIEQVIIDGFKSYAHRTVLDGFDSHFNAITGRNGTGKSNIFDAICFVLGLTNLKMARADDMVNLIYKDGQGGVTKASVTVVFNNSNKTSGHCPVGYEDQDKITVTRQIMYGAGGNSKKKYLLNGRNAQVQTITNLFHSVQLNVANPHFMIMQGKITSVTNMKPQELLALLEEAAGLRMFETRKNSALQSIERKDQKLKEVDNLLAEEIEPKLGKLQNEMAAYTEYQKYKVLIEQLTRLHIAWQYHSSKEAASSGERRITEKEKEIEDAQSALQDSQHDQKRYEKLIAEQKEKRKLEGRMELDGLEQKERELGKKQALANASVTSKRRELEDEKKRLKELHDSIVTLESEVSEKEGKREALAAAYKKLKMEHAKLQEQVQNRSKALALLNAGVAATEEGLSVADALMKYEKEKSELSTELKNSERKLKSLSSQLEEKRVAAERMEDESADLKKALQRVEQEYEKLKVAVNGVPYDPANEKGLRSELDDANRKHAELHKSLLEAQGSLANIRFDYVDPEAGFDRSVVKGVVAQLIHVKDVSTMTAVEVAAGARLYNVVVATESAASALLARGRLKKRVTFIPLNKIDGSTIDERREKEAAKLTGNKARLALRLIDYNDELDLAMRYIFGNTFICEDSEAAKLVMTKLQTVAVTLDGDVYNPTGIVTGGAKKSLGDTLKHVHQVQALQRELKKIEVIVASKKEALAELHSHKDQYQKANQQLEKKKLELEGVQRQLQRTSKNQTLEECAQLEGEIQRLKGLTVDLQERLRQAEQRHAELDRQKGEMTCSRERIAKAQKDLEAAKAAEKKAAPKAEEAQSNAEEVTLEIDQQKQEILDVRQRLKEQEAAIERTQEEVGSATQRAEHAHQEYQAAKKELETAKQKLAKANEALQRLEDELDSAKSREADINLKIKNLEHGLKQLKKDILDSAHHAQRLLHDNPWIEQIKHSLGKPGEFDFSKSDPQATRRKLEELKEKEKMASKTVNLKVVSMCEAVTQEYEDLKRKRRQVLHDRTTIENAIVKLEEEKRAALRKSYMTMNQEFGNIFARLLPDAEAKLDPIEKNSELAGLELKVAFSGQWKDSLNQLSGGQRSLMALSFLLALLKLNPAPMYVLDEVDSALDISHTQNIGKMLRSTFTESQFLVISHKEGMFNNANVIFTTDAHNGQSTVKRTKNR